MITTTSVIGAFTTASRVLRTRESWVMLGLGFSAGLPFLLSGATIGFWMRQEGLSLSVIGWLQWVSLFYGVKVLWAPLMERAQLPFLHQWLGQRRSYMLLCQVLIALGLCLMAVTGPKGGLLIFAGAAAFVAFASASQEIAIDGWRVDITRSQLDEAVNPALYSLGYKVAVLISGSLILIPAEHIGWPLSFAGLAAAMTIGVAATLLARPTEVEKAQTPAKSIRELILDPMRAFFGTYGATSVLILVTIALYRLPDYLIGPVAGPMYTDTGLSNEDIAYMRSTIGLLAAFVGVAIGGACVLWLGTIRTFAIGALAGPLSNIGFAMMVQHPGDLAVFGATLAVDNISNGVAEAAFIALLTRLTARQFSLTHYALMYSVSALTGKLLKGFSGQIVDALTPSLELMGAYQAFFTGTALIGLPAVALCLWLARLPIMQSKKTDAVMKYN